MHSQAFETHIAKPLKRGLVFAKYGDLAASTRQRFVQALPYLAEENIELDISPLFDNAYLSTLFSTGKRRKRKLIKAYLNRFKQLRQCSHYDFVLVQYELFPYLPARFEKRIHQFGKRVFYDIDDAIFHQYDQHKNPLVRRLLGQKLLPLLKRVDLAFCGNAYLRDYVAQYAKRVEIVPTTVDITQFTPAASILPSSPPVLGWIGSPSTWNYCLPYLDLLTRFAKAIKLTVMVIGAGHKAEPRDNFEFRDWVEEREVSDIQQMDMGIMPIPDEPWARGKCGYKLIQYMACGLPVIASPVGVNSSIVSHGENGFLASSEEEWRDAIEQLLNDSALRQRMGKIGRAKAEELYSIQVHGPRMAKMLRGALL